MHSLLYIANFTKLTIIEKKLEDSKKGCSETVNRTLGNIIVTLKKDLKTNNGRLHTTQQTKDVVTRILLKIWDDLGYPWRVSRV